MPQNLPIAKPNMDAIYANQLNEQRNKDALYRRTAEIQEAEQAAAGAEVQNQLKKTTLLGTGAVSVVAIINDILLGWLGGGFITGLFGINETVSTAVSASAATATAAGTAATLAAATIWIPGVNIGTGLIAAASLTLAAVVAIAAKLSVQALGFEVIIALYGVIKFLNLITSSILYFWMKSKNVANADLKALANVLIRIIPAIGDILPTSVISIILVYLKERKSTPLNR